jgi:UDP-N-acetylmuramyl pentapeptide phosphotransferase/UDP-N-acetylglucosamine-1-phosphate transferase
MAIFSGAKIATTLLVLGLPLLDLVIVTLRRVLVDRVSPFRGDLQHLHHHLSARVKEKWATLALVLGSAILGLVAVLFQGFEKMIALVIAIVILGAFDVWLNWRGRKE